MYNFDEVISREKTYSLKWDGVKERYGIDNKGLLPMWVADMDFRTAPEIVEAVIHRANHGVFGYVGGYHEDYYGIVQNWFKKRHSTDINKEWIVIGDTIVATLNRIIRTFTEPTEKIIIQTPVYPPFHNSIKNNGRTIIYNPLKFDGKKYVMDYENLEEKIDSTTRLMILCSPHNPVGRVWTKEELLRLSEICIENDIILVSDEIHNDIVFSSSRHTMIHEISDRIKDRSIICTSPHKSFNIAGLQISNTIIPNETIRTQYKKSLEREGITKPNIFGLTATMAAYENGEKWLSDLLIYLENNLNFIEKFIRINIPDIHFVRPEGTFLVWLDLNHLNLTEKQLQKVVFDKAGIVLNSGPSFGQEGTGFVRLNFACPKAVLEEGLNKLKNAVQNI